MPQGPKYKRPLPIILLELAGHYRGLILVRGRQAFRIEDIAGFARREAASGDLEVRQYLSAFKFWWEEDPDGKVVVMTDTPSGPRPLAAEYGSRFTALALDNEGDWGREMVLSGSLGKVDACEGAVFERRCYTPGGVYSFDELPSLSRKDALKQKDDFEAHFGHGPEVMHFRFLMIPHAEVVRLLEEHYGSNLSRALQFDEVQKLPRSIQREGLKYPAVADEGWKRALAIASLGQDLPYFEVLPSFEMPEPQWIPSLEGRR